MIQILASKYSQHIASLLLILFEISFIPAYGSIGTTKNYTNYYKFSYNSNKVNLHWQNGQLYKARQLNHLEKNELFVTKASTTGTVISKADIGGPTQPEMSSFKSVGVDNMVNLFTGDFSYNIPLLDVGGYPVNLFYDGGISMEQEASWVGLGWNINPGSVSRNMRGIPDDFNGEDELVQEQKMKPNNTWGFDVGYDLELLGVDFQESIGQVSAGISLGYSYNNYLGPALDLGVHGNSYLKLGSKAGSEKSPLNIGVGLGADINSRNGLTITPNVSLNTLAFQNDNGSSLGIGARLSTSYNSRVGIKQLQLSEQMSYNYQAVKNGTMGRGYVGIPLSSSVISFSKPSYIPSIRKPVTNHSYAGRYEMGTGMFGVKGSVEGDVYIQKSTIEPEDVVQKKKMVGYLYYQNANNDPNAVLDFTRFNDNEVTPKTPIISAPQYAYDVFSVQGEGTGGSIRAYRNDIGYVRDVTTRSKDKSISAGVDLGPGGHYGANFNQVKTPTYIGEWRNGNGLRNSMQFKSADKTFENVYFRNPGETSVLNENQFKSVGGTDLVRFKLGGSDANPIVDPVLEHFSTTSESIGIQTNVDTEAPELSQRKKRTQVTNFLNAKEAGEAGLDKIIKSYNGTTVLGSDNNLQFAPIDRNGGYRKGHHISQINVTELSGRRYVYGLPVYNIVQKDFSFSVRDEDQDADLVDFEEIETKAKAEDEEEVSPYLKAGNKKKDGFVQVTTTPAYAHSFLLSGLLSPDYVDASGDGITEDDQGDAVKFNYTKVGTHKWKTPFTSEDYKANFNAGHRTETKDDKGLITYGERESWYLHSIESKTMIALFTLEDRADAKGVENEFRGIDANSYGQKRLQKIDLFSKADLKKNGFSKAKPIKTVWFEYSHTLCPGTPDNATGGGKLTLDGIYFTFNGKSRVNKNRYIFSYTKNGEGNPAFTRNASDRWGTYKPVTNNPEYPKDGASINLKNAVFPYATQKKLDADKNAAAWSLKTIVLPSGGQIDIEYESDDYAYVQNRRAATMMQLKGLGNSKNVAAPIKSLYSFQDESVVENEYVFIKVPDANGDIKKKYLEGLDQLAFKLSVNMPKGGDEYIHCYATVDYSDADAYGKYDETTIWVKLKKVDGLSPLTLSALDYLRERLPGQAFTGFDVSETTGLKQVMEMLGGMSEAIAGAFKNPIKFLRDQGKAKTINPERSFVRLNEPNGFKYGGGHRVKSVKLKDNWQAMTGQYTSEYGNTYEYTTSEATSSGERLISSGVASYEPSIGGEENPFQSILQVTNQLPLGPASYGAIEMPVLDAFFPAPLVGYSKVTVRSVKKSYIDTEKHKSRSGIGKQVTEFYTAKDYPVYYNHTSIDPSSDKVYREQSLFNFFYKYSVDRRAISQGFLVATNDMHGKLKSQASYAEGDEKTPINYTENFYRNTGVNGPEEFDFVYGQKGGVVKKGYMGMDVELMTDMREFSVESISNDVQAQVDNIVPPIVWTPFVWFTTAKSEQTYRAVTTTKVINYHSILDKVVVMDKGSTVSTEILIYDAETGQVVVSKTNNEFDQPIYNINYPAYWAYSGMGLAYENIDAVYSNVEIRDGKITGGMTQEEVKNVFESGDELYVTNNGTASDFCAASLSGGGPMLWAFDKNRNSSSLINTAPDFVFIDKDGKLYTQKGVSFRVVRSGKRNMLSAPVASITTITYPVASNGTERKLIINTNSKVINATAVEYKEKWQTDNDIINKYKQVYDPNTCSYIEIIDCNGYLEKSINPYQKGLLGNFKTHRDMVFYGNRSESDPLQQTSLQQNGFLDNFKLYWDFNTEMNLIPDLTNTKWVWNNQVTRLNSKGLELETKDALNIYTAAQYGYNKTTPVAIVNNSRYSEMFYEGFEDNSFSASLSGSKVACSNNRYINIASAGNIIHTNGMNFDGHSGKYVLGVSSGSGQITLPVINSLVEDFSLQFTTDNPKGLVDIGGSVLSTTTGPNTSYEQVTSFTSLSGVNGVTGANGMDLSIGLIEISTTPKGSVYCGPGDPQTVIDASGSYSINESHYIEIPEDGMYTLTFGINERYESGGGNHLINTSSDITHNEDAIEISAQWHEETALCPYLSGSSPTQREEDVTMKINITDQNGHPFSITSVKPYAYSLNSFNKSTFTLCFPKGIYKINTTNSVSYKVTNALAGSIPIETMPRERFTLSIARESAPDSFFPIYKSTATQTTCSFKVPVKGDGAMLNPVFSIPAGKKMLFSAWVKQDCGGTPCNNKVSIDFGNGNTENKDFTPSGPIIDGWQRIEETFTAPQDATTATLKFINNSSQMIYFDDIRIHPFNANMKSYVYDSVNLRLTAELDANNYATFYEYDEEGTLVRTKVETKEGVNTINETRSFKQEKIAGPQ